MVFTAALAAVFTVIVTYEYCFGLVGDAEATHLRGVVAADELMEAAEIVPNTRTPATKGRTSRVTKATRYFPDWTVTNRIGTQTSNPGTRPAGLDA